MNMKEVMLLKLKAGTDVAMALTPREGQVSYFHVKAVMDILRAHGLNETLSFNSDGNDPIFLDFDGHVMKRCLEKYENPSWGWPDLAFDELCENFDVSLSITGEESIYVLDEDGDIEEVLN